MLALYMFHTTKKKNNMFGPRMQCFLLIYVLDELFRQHSSVILEMHDVRKKILLDSSIICDLHGKA
jgi:hypothetical protein